MTPMRTLTLLRLRIRLKFLDGSVDISKTDIFSADHTLNARSLLLIC